ncbi:hypothetical protein BDV41DRAFT_562130 [Aspergillus transmontanensis]|uniref:Uncharacterized protein n=1 Tax=Aspergillus transmontanensis TaxID=1034304 RepID=A0A5N6W6Q2_9EURO|nr:hypothetical protein BDV41DRAFT_562130 [Aspergillus transmontanensis]
MGRLCERPSSTGSSRESTSILSICSDTESTYSNKCASNRGYGTDDTLAVTQVLEQHGIPCCLVGVAALVFYGAGRVRDDWEICVLTELMDQAAELLQSEPYGINHYFFLVPSVDVHIDCEPSNFIRSPRDLPYPKLDVSIQSCLDTCDLLQLYDVIDGTNVSEEWGENNLDLKGTNDEFGGKWAHSLFAWGGQRNKREMWKSLVHTKGDRLDWTTPKDVFITQHRVIGAPDP